MISPADDAELLARAWTGGRMAFDALAAPHLPRLRSFLHRLVAHPTEDLAQDTMVQPAGSSPGRLVIAVGDRAELQKHRPRHRTSI